MSEEGKEFLFEEEARRKLVNGISQVVDTTAITLGPKGSNVGLQTGWGSPSITRDGGAIAKEIELKNPFENMGASLAKEVAAKIKEASGDGTTTGLILLKALVQEGFKQISSGSNPVFLKKGLEKGLELLFQKIDQMATPIHTAHDIENIATVAASGDQEIGKMISLSFEKAGKEGVIAIEEGKGTTTEMEWVQGMELDRGYASPYFCTNQDRMSVELEDPYILITDQKIRTAQDLLPILQQVNATGDSLLIVAEEIDGDALSTLVLNKLRGILKVAAIKAPSFGEKRKALLEDLAILTHAQVITEDKGLLLKNAEIGQLGKAGRVSISKEKTAIVDGRGEKGQIDARILQIEKESKTVTSKFEKEELQKRKAKLLGGAALIRVGAPTESEMKRKKQSFEDSLHSTKAALAEGIVTGGGIALLRASKTLEKKRLPQEEEAGLQLLLRACAAPFRQIVINTGFEPSVIMSEVLAKEAPFGFNALTEKVEDLFASGIIDPVKVIKESLSHAVSMAGVVFFSEVLIA